MNEITYFQCSYCKQQYANKQQAIDCEKQPIEKPCVEVGQIVEMCFGYGWFDGDKRWVINLDKKNAPRITEHGNCFDRCCTMGFYYVVTAIEKDKIDPHRLKYHVFTKAMTGKQGHEGGYTYFDRHVTPSPIFSAPEFVKKDSKSLIGKKSEWLF